MPGGGQRVYIGNIPSDSRDRDLERFFKGYGRIREIVIKNGYGFVEFDDYRDADDAVSDLDGKELQGGRVRVELARDPRDRRDRDRGGRFGRDGGRDGRRRGNPPGPKTNYRVVVENLSSRTSWQDLKDYFRSAGDITYTNAHTPRSGEGIVEFASKRGLEYALSHRDELELDGRKLRIYEENRRGGGSRSRSRSDSRGRSRSRSRSRSPRYQSRSKSRSRSRSKSRSRSRTPDDRDKNGRDSRSRSRSGSHSRSRSRSRNQD